MCVCVSVGMSVCVHACMPGMYTCVYIPVASPPVPRKETLLVKPMDLVTLLFPSPALQGVETHW